MSTTADATSLVTMPAAPPMPPPTPAPAALPALPSSTGNPRGGRPYRLSFEQYYHMIDAGILGPGDRVELWEGWLFEKMAKNEPHIIASGELFRAFLRLIPEGWHPRHESPINLDGDRAPEPDLAIVRGRPRDYPRRPPASRDVALVVEVSDTTLSKDLGRMLAAYAGQMIPVYWVVNLVAGRIEVHSDPDGTTYRHGQSFGPEDEVPVVLDGREVGRVAVRDILP